MLRKAVGEMTAIRELSQRTEHERTGHERTVHERTVHKRTPLSLRNHPDATVEARGDEVGGRDGTRVDDDGGRNESKKVAMSGGNRCGVLVPRHECGLWV